MLPRISTLLAMLLVLSMMSPSVDAAMCTKDKFATEYAVIQTQMKTCEVQSKISLVWPLGSKSQRDTLCSLCPQLLATITTNDGAAVPDCRVKQNDGQIFNLLKLLQQFFRPCVGGSSASDSKAGSSGSDSEERDAEEEEETEAPAAATTTPTTTTKTTKKPMATPSTRTNSTAAAGANGSTTKATSSEDSSMGIGVIIGIAAGGVVFLAAIVVAVVLVRRRKNQTRARRAESDKFDSESALDSSTGRASTAPFQFSLISGGKSSTGGGGGSGGNRSDAYYRPSKSTTDGSGSQPPPQINLWEDTAIIAARVPKDKVFVNALLSRGGFGEVYQGIYNRQAVAIKMLLPETRKDLSEITALFAEVKLMASLEHDRIVNFVGVAWDSLNDVCVLSEFMEGGDLRGALVRFEENRRPHGFDHDKVKIALHVAHALTYLHSLRPQVLHRDLKSKNILLDNQLNAKVTDFGVSRESSYRTMTAGVGTSLWMAPEVMMGERYDEKADVFSFGVVLSELDSHAVPYRHFQESNSSHRIPDTAVLQMVSLGRLKVKFSENAIPEMVELGNACVSVNPKNRPTASDALYTLHNVLKSMYLVT